MKPIHSLLSDMLNAYDNGDADADRRGFIAGWALTLAPPKNAASYEVLVTGDPLDGFTIEGPYPQGFLDSEGVVDSRENGGWIIPLTEPTP